MGAQASTDQTRSLMVRAAEATTPPPAGAAAAAAVDAHTSESYLSQAPQTGGQLAEIFGSESSPSELGHGGPRRHSRRSRPERIAWAPGLPGVEEKHVREAFQQIDFDGNGFIGVSELRFLLTACGERPNDEELDDMIRMLDADGRGQVSCEEFLTMFSLESPVLAEMVSMAPPEG